MAVFRINKTKNYTVMSNYHLRDNNLLSPNTPYIIVDKDEESL